MHYVIHLQVLHIFSFMRKKQITAQQITIVLLTINTAKNVPIMHLHSYSDVRNFKNCMGGPNPPLQREGKDKGRAIGATTIGTGDQSPQLLRLWDQRCINGLPQFLGSTKILKCRQIRLKIKLTQFYHICSSLLRERISY